MHNSVEQFFMIFLFFLFFYLIHFDKKRTSEQNVIYNVHFLFEKTKFFSALISPLENF